MDIRNYHINEYFFAFRLFGLRKITMFKYLCTLGVCFLLWGCPVYDPASGELDILNYTDSAIYVYHTCLDSLPFEYGLKLFLNVGGGIDECGHTKKDTIAPSYRINAYSWGSIGGLGTPKRRETGCKDNKLRLYFIKEITMRTKTWEEIFKNQLYEKKVVLDQKQLDSLCWRVTYEPEKK